jgi:hypothetical protein
MLNRRTFLGVLSGVVAAPMIVRYSSFEALPRGIVLDQFEGVRVLLGEKNFFIGREVSAYDWARMEDFHSRTIGNGQSATPLLLLPTML